MNYRRITETDRMLAYSDRIERATGRRGSARRRTHRQFGQLDLIIVEETGRPTTVYMENEDSGVIVEATADELLQAAAAVRELLASPPPSKRTR
jgi:hypothetical protein